MDIEKFTTFFSDQTPLPHGKRGLFQDMVKSAVQHHHFDRGHNIVAFGNGAHQISFQRLFKAGTKEVGTRMKRERFLNLQVGMQFQNIDPEYLMKAIAKELKYDTGFFFRPTSETLMGTKITFCEGHGAAKAWDRTVISIEKYLKFKIPR